MKKMIKRGVIAVCGLLMSFNLMAQTPSFECRVENETYPSSTTYEFDVKLYATGATSTWEYATGVFYINMNSSFRNAGTITAAIVASTSDLVAAQIPTSVSYNAAGNYAIIAAKTPPGAGAGTTITQSGIRVVRLRLSNTVNFSTTAPPNLVWRFNPSPTTAITAYIGGINTAIASSTATAGQTSCKTPSYWNGTAWNKGIGTPALPVDTNDAVIFTGTYPSGSYPGTLNVRSLTIATGSTYNVPDTGSLKIKTNLVNNGTCVFKSSNSGTAKFLTVPTGANVTGNFTVERFIVGSSGRRYRYLAAPFASGPTIASSWQQQIHISGNGTGGTVCPNLVANSNGFDATSTNNPSMYTFNEATAVVNNSASAVVTGATVYNNAWSSIPNTTSTNLTAGVGYNVFVRGNKSSQGCALLNGTNPTPSNVTLSATGTLVVGAKSLPVTYSAGNGEGWNLVGNPYACPINWDAAGWTKTNVDNNLYIYKASGNHFATWNGALGTGVNNGSNIIESGNAFFVKANAASPALSVTESCKSSTNASTSMFKTNAKILRALFVKQGELQDEAIVAISPMASNGVDEMDSEKMSNPSLNIYSITDANKKNAINTISEVQSQTIIPMGIGSIFNGTHEISFKGVKEFENYDVLLEDKYTGTITLINEKDLYSFEINSDLNSKGEGRFFLIFVNRGNDEYLKNIRGIYSAASRALNIYPNPTTGSAQVNITELSGNNAFVKLYNALGQEIESFSKEISNGSVSIDLDLTNRNSGIYFVEVSDASGKVSKGKLVRN